MKKLLSEILTDEMLTDIFKTIKNNETYEYSDGNMQFSISPNGISIQYQSETPKKETSVEKDSIKNESIEKFTEFCESIDDKLFMEICDTFEDGELNKLSKNLNSDKYQDTISIFTKRAKEVSNKKLEEITKSAREEVERQKLVIKTANNTIDEILKSTDEEIKTQYMNIENAESIIKDIYAELDRAQSKYSI